MSAWVAKAAVAARVSPNTIGRLLAVREFLDRVSGTEVPPIWSNPDELPFSSLEILKRIYAIDSTLALSLIHPVIRGDLSLRELREKHEDLLRDAPAASIPARSLTRRAGTVLANSLHRTIANDLGRFGCPSTFTFRDEWPRRHAYQILVDAVAFDPVNIVETIVGFDLFSSGHLSTTAHRRPIGSELYRMAYVSSFFRRYVAILGDNVRQSELDSLFATLSATGRNNIDIAVVGTEGESGPFTINVVRRASKDALPHPDCRTLVGWEKVLRSKPDH